ncbi:MAG: flagellar motor switch protein FliM [Methylococcales bacterium]|nr:flagellar motor switch protein FliM [Methylobacter sp.]MDZ4157151.1 flagellar motor switch protein FliM [Methylococcales bacterium]MDP2099220.1 flagellar motor switch protein FliM [Methylobacter sp.]MDP2428420.1 flagellar motor switch protein FliM [Methylobacter sp.]MDP3056645.1 flagellar motor switch protein FliM [Methylobacter sp.]
MSDLLSQAEIDALLSGVSDGDIETEEESEFYSEGDAEEFHEKGVVREYDFASQERVVRGRMPTLEMVNERFARFIRISLFNFLRRSAEIFISGIQIQKFSEYIQGLLVPTNLTIVRFKPLRGKALIVIDPRLVFTVVENFFGGAGQFYNQTEGREFTPTEMRVVRIIVDMIFKDLKEAWKPVMDLDFEYVGSEINPRFANIIGPGEMIVISTIHVELEGGAGDINIAMPYAMLEPIRELLDAISSDSGEVISGWEEALRNEVLRAEVSINSLLVEKSMTIREVMQLRKGDVIPIEMPEKVLLKAEGIPVFEGKVGISDGNYAIQIIDKVKN